MFRQLAPLFLHELVANAAARDPDTVAVADRNGSWTYAQLNSHAMEYATHIAAAGVRVGDRVLIRATAERWVIAAIYACSRIGAMAVPLNSDLPPAQWEQISLDAEPALVMSGPLPTAGPATAWKPASRANVDPDAAVLLLYTSGSTAAPKAVVCAHRSVLFATTAIASRLNYRSDDVVLCRLPLSFDYGLYQAFLTALCGATLVLSGPGDDAGLLGIMRRHGVTVAPVVPSLATMLARLAVRGTVPTVRLFTNTGQELTPPQIDALRRSFPSAAVQLMYGTTECKRITIGQPNEDLALPGSVGSPLPGTSVQIIDNDARPVSPGVEGQITVAGPHLMNGYWRDEELTARIYRKDAVTGERVLHTGDYGHIDEGGNLFFHGRRDELFKHHGVRTSVAEIEAAARAVPDVDEAAVVPPRGDDEAVLFAVTVLAPSEVLRRLRDRLDPLKVPAHCRTLARLPLGPRGKIDRTALAALVDGEKAQAARA
ncbi:class I adenylate-forming enzyme family protein [Nocardia abscessus]|uniref:class I adenylate-forming enzyme family protein n=1 Tax=Nocardia abscessus TaxID=120957 RepID=UPI002453FD80|nr:AMP-binding protein [Nocardia abscessus]